MAQTPSISVRQGLQWADELLDPIAQLEPTSTLVLTSPRGRFVDLRVLRPTTTHVLPFAQLLSDLGDDLGSEALNLARVDWAFAGTSSRTVTTPAKTANGDGELAQAQWNHWVDSRHADAGAVVDRGNCRAYYDRPQGCMMEEELGEMVNPATGTLQPYRETWALPDPTLGLDGALNSSENRVCIVLELQSRAARGVLIRVGAWIQGVQRHGDHVSTARYQLTEHGWKHRFSVGSQTMPFPFPCVKCAFPGPRTPATGQTCNASQAESQPDESAFHCTCAASQLPAVNGMPGPAIPLDRSGAGRWILVETSAWDDVRD